MAANADLEKVYILDTQPNEKGVRLFDLNSDLDRLAATIGKIGGTSLIIIDPITAYLGKADANNNGDVRSILAKLAQLAEAHDTSVLAISHLNKDANKKAAYRGMIFMKNAGAIIVVNSLHHPNRQRFTLAHELGHFELHMTEIGSEVHVYKRFLAFARNAKSSMGWDRKEIEANRFAGELLVPHHMLVQELRDREVDVEDERLITEMAGRFKVSRQMMTFRISGFVASGSNQPQRR
jgi:Zn-dependent peptidase ImmA (M78 family)